ncbi:MAG: XdhC family protein [Candidatus Eisenbacteria bacterium]|nr:XdhC family protein [Candidatus Eisenbacteria bacterium]
MKPGDIYEEAARMQRDGLGGVIATVVFAGGSTPRGAGAKMIVYADGKTLGSVGGGSVESSVIERALAMMGTAEPVLVSFGLDDDAGMICGGRLDVFLEPLVTGPRVLVVGGGHVGLAVARVAKDAGFRVEVVDDRPEMVSSERFPFADRRFAGGVELLEGELDVDESAYVVVVTRGHRFDREWVEALAGRWPAYLGMIGSLEKVQRTFTQLADSGVDARLIESIYAPVGLDIGAETPEEIAVSVVAEMIAVRHGITDTAMLKDKAEHKGRNRT